MPCREKKCNTAFMQRQHQQLWCFTTSAVHHTAVVAVTVATTIAVTTGVTDTVHAPNIAFKAFKGMQHLNMYYLQCANILWKQSDLLWTTMQWDKMSSAYQQHAEPGEIISRNAHEHWLMAWGCSVWIGVHQHIWIVGLLTAKTGPIGSSSGLYIPDPMGKHIFVGEHKNAWMDHWKNRWMNKRMNEQMNQRMNDQTNWLSLGE